MITLEIRTSEQGELYPVAMKMTTKLVVEEQ